MNHRKSYIICSMSRSGTTLLTDLLTDTGVAGWPNSFFRLQSMRWWAQEFGVSIADWEGETGFDQVYLDAVLTYGAGETGVFGMRFFWDQMDNLIGRLGEFFDEPSEKELLQAAFDQITYIHLTRQDKVTQAVSRIKAEQSGLWHIHPDGSERERAKPPQAPRYDAHALAQQVAEYTQFDIAWENWFDQQDIQPLRITYEALSENPQATLATVLSAIGLDPAIADVVAPRTKKLADGESDEWVARFQAEKSKIRSDAS